MWYAGDCDACGKCSEQFTLCDCTALFVLQKYWMPYMRLRQLPFDRYQVHQSMELLTAVLDWTKIQRGFLKVSGLMGALSMSSSVSFLVHWSTVFLQEDWQIKAEVEQLVLRPCTVPWLQLAGARVLLA